MHLRRGITFQDGETLDANAVKKDLDLVKASPLTGASLSATSMEITDPYTIRFHMNQAWSAFPYSLTLQIGYIAAPKQLDDKVNGPSNPIGTGPFVFKSWQRGTTRSTSRRTPTTGSRACRTSTASSTGRSSTPMRGSRASRRVTST